MDHASLPGKTYHDDDDFKNLPPNTLFLAKLVSTGVAPVSLPLHSTWFPSRQPRVGEEARLLHEEHLHL